MSFFDKLKKGVTDAGAKAINTVEANRLKGVISKNNEQIEFLYAEIGKKVFSEYHSQSLQLNEPIENDIKQIYSIIAENKQLETDIKAIWNQKDCVCGKSVPLDAKFCSACGHRFNLIAIPEGSHAVELIDASSNVVIESDASSNRIKDSEKKPVIEGATNICPNCDMEVEPDAKFCGDCGHML